MVNKELNVQHVNIKKVVKVTEGGRNFRFSAMTVVGNKGEIGFGIGKNKEVSNAMTKAESKARKRMFRFPITASGTIHHKICGKYNRCIVCFWPAPDGIGIRVGGAARKIFEACGIKNISGKIINSKSEQNVIHATIDALGKLRDPLSIAQQRGVTLEKVFEG